MSKVFPLHKKMSVTRVKIKGKWEGKCVYVYWKMKNTKISYK